MSKTDDVSCFIMALIRRRAENDAPRRDRSRTGNISSLRSRDYDHPHVIIMTSKGSGGGRLRP
jgi:hypothetical protein